MKSARLTSLEDLPFPLPHGVIEAERLRLSPVMADAALFRDLRNQIAERDLIIDQLQADVRAQARVIGDYTAEDERQLACTFDVSESIATLSRVVDALVASGQEVVMKFELVGDRRSLNVYVRV